MASYSAEHQAQIARALEVKAVHENRLLDLPGVNAIGMSLKAVAGELVPEFALIVHVTEKRPLDALSPPQRIPPEIDGVKTDVVVGGPFRAGQGPAIDDTAYRPLRGGAAISIEGRGKGTLGCIVVNQDATIDPSKKFLLLTNAHVLFQPPDLHRTNENVGQPDTCSVCSPCLDRTIARLDHDGVLSAGAPPAPMPTPAVPGVDAGVATLNPGTQWLPEVIATGEGDSITTKPIAGIRSLKGPDPLEPDPDVLFKLDEQGNIKRDKQGHVTHLLGVYKRGARTRESNGWVHDLHITNNIEYQDLPSDPSIRLRLYDQIGIVPKTDHVAFALQGDSGSVVLDAAQQIVGLLYGVPLKEKWGDTPFFEMMCTASPIAAVQDHLNVKVADRATYPGVQIVPQPLHTVTPAVAVADEAPASFVVQRLADAQDELQRTVTGSRLAQIARVRIPEIRALIEGNLRVAVVWGRIEGRRWLEQGLQCVLDRGYAFPSQLEGRSLVDCAERLMGILEVHGSAELAREARWFRELVPAFAGRSFDEVLALLDGDAGG
jgi:hypothetical protein